MSNVQLFELMLEVENLSEIDQFIFKRVLEQNQIIFEEYEAYKRSKVSDVVIENKKLYEIFQSNDRNFFTISSKKDFEELIVYDNKQVWAKTFVFSPLNDHSRVFLKKGDVLFCYRQGQFDSLNDALDKRGIYGIGFAASDPLVINQQQNDHNKYGVIVAFPLLLNKRLSLRNIQLHPVTISLTPYNGNRNDALQHIPKEIHYKTILNLLVACNPTLKLNLQSMLGFPVANTKLPVEVWKKENRLLPVISSSKAFNPQLCFNSIVEAGFVIEKKFFIRFLVSLFTKPFVLFTGLSGSGKTKLAIIFAKWICQHNLNQFQILKEALESESIQSNYKICHISEKTIELTNKSGSSGKIIPLPTKAIYEWYEEITSGTLNIEDDPKVIRHQIGKKSLYQKHVFGFYTEFHKISVAMSKVIANEDYSDIKQYEVISVGADWTNREHLLGYSNALDNNDYIKPENGALDLLLRANENPELPFFLILDEMNLSHVERYFADFLSSMESDEVIALHTKETYLNDVPESICLPKNLFIIGTVNIDETTYMFSPKVLDRANVIEFRVTEEEMKDYLDSPKELDMDALSGVGASMGESFVAKAKERGLKDEKLKDDLMPFFVYLEKAGAEFGYRTASEMSRFVKICTDLADGEMTRDEVIDAAIMQKLLPKLHGSRKKLVSILEELIKLCVNDDGPKYALSHEKLNRMLKRVQENGFTSYAEA
jgi:hypothetical protein